MTDIFLCAAQKKDEQILIKSPSVGRAMLFMQKNHRVSSGQIIGDFFQLNKRYCLKLPDDSDGVVVQCKDDSRIINLAFGEVFLTIDQSDLDDHKKIKSAKERALETHQSIDAPMDGMFYLSPSPNSPPFINIGDKIMPGQTLGLIEVMKCFYPVKFQGDRETNVVGINIKNATPVTSGTPIFVVESRK